MYKLSTLKNGLTLITVDLPHLESVTTMVVVGAGSRYEAKENNGVAHFFEHMFFKGSRKYPTALEIANLVDGVGAINNAFTGREYTGYFVKSAASHMSLAADIISSSLFEPILAEEEIEREKGVVIEELRMYRDDPSRHIWDLFVRMIFGDTPLGRNIGGAEEVLKSFGRQDFLNYLQNFYSPKNMALIFVGNTGNQATKIAQEYFGTTSPQKFGRPTPFKEVAQRSSRADIFYKKTDQANVMLGGIGYSRQDPRRYALALLTSILGEGMSSRLFIQVRERRGLAYSVYCESELYQDTGLFAVYAGLKLEKALEGVKIIKEQLERLKVESVGEEELRKAKEMQRGRMAIRSESTNFLATFYGLQWVLDQRIETLEEYLEKIDAVTAEDVKKVANDLFQGNKLNLQIIGPLKNLSPFEKIIKG